MFDPFTIALLGSALGGLTNKKDPLKGALIGGGLGLGGGLLAAPGAAASAGAEGFAGLGGAGGSGLAGGVPGFLSQPSALESIMGVAKPVGQAAGAASAVQGLLGNHQQPLPPSPIAQPQPNGNLNQIVSGNNQQSQLFQQQSEQERARRMALLGRIGGR
jgi:hypothetical protein